VNEEKPEESYLTIFVHEDKRHTFHEDSFVAFREIQGMTELNTLAPARVTRVLDGYSFRI
jgi:hypothetical protein